MTSIQFSPQGPLWPSVQDRLTTTAAAPTTNTGVPETPGEEVPVEQNETRSHASADSPAQVLSFPEPGSEVLLPANAQADDTHLIENAKNHINEQFQHLAQAKPVELEALLSQIYGDKLSADKMQNLMQQARDGNLPMPEFRFVASEDLQGHHAAYGNGTVYLSEDLRAEPDLLNMVVNAEFGHHLDKVLGGEDTLGDEGQMLALGLAQGGGPLSAEDLEAARELSDHKAIEIDGERVEVETIAPAVAAGLWWAGKVAAQTTVDTAIDMAIAAVMGLPAPGARSTAMNILTNAIPGIGSWRTARKLDKLSKAIQGVRRNMAAIARMPGGQQILTRFNRSSQELRQALSSGQLGRAQDKLKEMLDSIQDAHVLRHGDNAASAVSRSDFYRNLPRMNPSERVAKVRGQARDFAQSRGWEPQPRLRQRNGGRDIYYDRQNNRYLAVDTQHGDFEILNSRGRHQGSMDLWGEQSFPRHGRVDSSGGHDIFLD